MLNLLVIYAHWCPICNMMLPLVEEVESDYKEQICIRRVDVEQNPEVYEEYGIQIVPTFILYANQIEVARMAGMISERIFRERIEYLMKGEE